jgi:aryl-alcohol dehydrogenase-like predicted oxidoreductase
MIGRTAARTEGRATPEGTAGYRARIGVRVADGHFRELRVPAGSLRLSSIGLGTYLGGDDDATDRRYEEAIARALELGCNVLDAAINYRSMRSERSIGRALAAAFAAGTLRRDEVVVATKAGFLPFDGEAGAGGPEPALPVGGAARARSRRHP